MVDDVKDTPFGKLTENELKAANHFILYGKQIDAYRCGYSTDNMKVETQRREAHDVFNRPRVQHYILNKQAGQAAEFDMQVKEIKKVLAAVASKCLKERVDAQGNLVPVNPQAVVAAMAEINRMNGNHAAVKTDVTGLLGLAPVTTEEYHAARQKLIESDEC